MTLTREQAARTLSAPPRTRRHNRVMLLMPVPLLGLSVLVGFLASPMLLTPEAFRLSLLPSAGLLVTRLVVEGFSSRWQPGSPPVVLGWILTVLMLLGGTLLNPFLCIYGFVGYVDAGRWLRGKLVWVAVVLTALICAVGQSGSIPGISAVPWMYLLLATVNLGVATVMTRLGELQERQLAERELAVAELAEAHRENLALHDQLMDRARERGVSAERARLSREIHDTVAQGLVGVITQLENLPADLPPEVALRVRRAEASARNCLTEARRAVNAMAPQELERQTLIEAVQQLVTSGATPLEVELRVTGEPLVGCHDDTAFRVIQEALTNARRHARAGRVTITLSWGGEALLVDVNDDGIGFDPLARTDGHGLRGMTDRVEQIGGRLVVESAAGAGSTISAVVPR